MRKSPPVPGSFVLGLLALAAAPAASLRAQEPTGRLWAVTPSVGFGEVLADGELESGGMSILVELDSESADYRWGAFAAVRGIGVSCSDGCDRSGQSFGVEGARLFGPVGLGVGVGLLHRDAGWRVQPHGQLSVSPGMFRVQLRVEFTDGDEVHIPLLLGIRVPVS